jgi:CsoR family transcriptional regulator, copper-sensing transcriptional repressor
MDSYSIDKGKLLERLRKVEGQVRGLHRMVSDDKYCIDILTQISSVQGALSGVALGLLDGHVRHCVRESLVDGQGDEKIEEMMSSIARMAGS